MVARKTDRDWLSCNLCSNGFTFTCGIWPAAYLRCPPDSATHLHLNCPLPVILQAAWLAEAQALRAHYCADDAGTGGSWPKAWSAATPFCPSGPAAAVMSQPSSQSACVQHPRPPAVPLQAAWTSCWMPATGRQRTRCCATLSRRAGCWRVRWMGAQALAAASAWQALLSVRLFNPCWPPQVLKVCSAAPKLAHPICPSHRPPPCASPCRRRAGPAGCRAGPAGAALC